MNTAQHFPLGHLTFVLQGQTFGIHLNYDPGVMNKPAFSGVIEKSTSTELQIIADAIDMICKGK